MASAPGDLNVLFVTADQWRGDCLGAAGHPVVRTPNLDRLAAGGVSFRRHFAQAAPCGPSRASLYTGMYLMNHRSVLNGTPLDARHTNVALVARELGYEPALFGYTDSSVDPRTVATRRSAPALLRRGAAGFRSGVRPPGGQSCALARLAARRRGRAARRLATRTSTSPPTERGGARSTTPNTRRPRSSPTACSTSSTTDRRRAPLGSRISPTSGRTRRSSRPRRTTRCSIPRRSPIRSTRRRAPRKARSTRCSAR